MGVKILLSSNKLQLAAKLFSYLFYIVINCMVSGYVNTLCPIKDGLITKTIYPIKDDLSIHRCI